MVYIKTRASRQAARRQKKTGTAAREAQLDEVFFALSHPARRRLLARLGDLGDQAVGPLAAPLPESPAQITKHLAILERAGLITREIAGRRHRLRLQPGGIRPALAWIERHRRFWNASIDRLEQFLAAVDSEET
jgi:DNA-binding transcriptional ArsR family regulator